MIGIELPAEIVGGIIGAIAAGLIAAIRSASRSQERKLEACNEVLDRLPSALTDADLVLASPATPTSIRVVILFVLKLMHDDDMARAFIRSTPFGNTAANGSQPLAQSMAAFSAEHPDLGAAARRVVMTGVMYLALNYLDKKAVADIKASQAIDSDNLLTRIGNAIKSASHHNGPKGPHMPLPV